MRSSGEEKRPRRRGEWGGPPGAGSNRPPGSRDRSNISCSSVWPAATWGVTERETWGGGGGIELTVRTQSLKITTREQAKQASRYL